MNINKNMTKYEKDVQISNYSAEKGFELFSTCQYCDLLNKNQKSLISVNLCIAYARRKIENYITSFDDMSIHIGFGKGDILAVSKIASDLSKQNQEEDEFQA